jgi:hypothetical protein
MSLLGNLTNFDHKTCEWSIFKGRLTQFIKVNAVVEDNQSAILLTHLTDESYRLLRNLAYPANVDELKYNQLIKYLDDHFKPKKCSYADKARFYGATRNLGETLGDWAARLRGLASYCDFGTALETNLADRFVLGLGPGPEREKLFEQNASELKLGQALKIAEKAESVREAKAVIAGTATIKEEPLYRASSEGRYRAGGGGVAREGSGARAPLAGRDQRAAPRCSVCGMKSHDGDRCRYKAYRCQKCGVVGHLKKVCKSTRLNNMEGVDNNLADQNCCEECQLYNLRYVSSKPIELNVTLGNIPVLMELDSGSGTCVMSQRMYLQYFSNYALKDCNIKMCLYNGHKISPLGYFSIEVKYNALNKNINIFVLKGEGPGLLGRDFMTAFNLVLTTKLNKISETNDQDVNKLLEQYPDLWRDELGSFNKFKVKLQLKENANPKFFKPRSVPFALKDKVEEELNRLVGLGVLVPVNHSQYATPIVPVLKENGKVRIAGDYSVTLNKDLIIDKYPLPRIEEVFARLGGGEHYSKIDLKNAYNQFLLCDSSQDLTTINTSKGLFKYTRLVYGLAPAPALFQKSMESLLSGIDGVSCWLDDICVTGPNKMAHLCRLRDVLSRLNEAGLRLQQDKCKFFKPSVTYLGYVINKEGLHTSPDKVKAIIDSPEPTNITEVKRFLGVVNYYRSFIPNASSIMSPLHELLRAGAEWQWGERQRSAVRRVKRELVSERTLAHFDPAARLELAVDAGPAGLGAVLSLRDRTGLERPLAFASRSLTPSERNYSQIQKEATAIIFGVKRFHQYLYGRSEPFILKTDHRPLVSIFNNNSGISVTTALRLQRYAIILSAYRYTVQYTTGASNVVADYFSRAPLPETITTTDKEFDTFCSLNFLDSVLPAVTANDIRQATENDTVLKTVIKYINKGWPRKITCKLIRPYFQCKTDLQLENGTLLRGHRVVIPSTLREKMLRELHSSHLGIIKMKSNARSRMWWPGIDGDIELRSAACDTCVALRPAPPREAPAPWPKPPGPFHRVHIDYLSIGQRVYLVVVDAYSKWLECVYMNNGTTTQELIKQLKKIFATFGLPYTLVSDNDAKINCHEFIKFCSSNNINYITSPVYHPNSNGMAESSVKICKKMLKCILRENLKPDVIHEKLLGYIFEYRNTMQCTTGETPATLMFGRKLRTRLDLILPAVKQNNSELPPHRRNFEIGDVVLARWYSARKETWEQGIVKSKIGNKMFKVYMSNFDSYCIRHTDQLIKYKGDQLIRLNMPPVDTMSANRGPVFLSPATTEPNIVVSQAPESTARIEGEGNVVQAEDEVWIDCDGDVGEHGPRAPAPPDAAAVGAQAQAPAPDPDPVAPAAVEPLAAEQPASRHQLRPRRPVDYKV